MWATGVWDTSPRRSFLSVFVQTSCTSLSDPLGIKTLCGGTVLPPTENILTSAPFMKKAWGLRWLKQVNQGNRKTQQTQGSFVLRTQSWVGTFVRDFQRGKNFFNGNCDIILGGFYKYEICLLNVSDTLAVFFFFF